MHSTPTARRAVAIALVGATIALTAGCSAASDGGSDGDDAITMWTFKQSHVAALEAAAEGFTEETGISVEIEAVTPDDAFATRVQSSAQSGDLPDVLEVHAGGEDRVFGAAGILQDLTPLVAEDISDGYIASIADSGVITAADVERSEGEGATDAGIVDGARYAVPFTIGTFGIVYANREKLEAAGFDAAPETWEEWVAQATATTQADPETGGISLGFQAISVGLNWVLNPMAFAALGQEKYEALWGDDTAADWSSPDGVRALELYSQLDGLWLPGTQNLTIDDADLAFVNGDAAFAVGGTFTLAFLEQNGMDLDNVIAFPMPEPEGGEVDDLRLSPIALTSLGITKDADTDAAAQWVEYLARPDVATEFAVAATDLPATDLGEGAADALGENLATLTAVFEGDEAQSYNVNTFNSLVPPGFSLDDAGAIVADVSPLQQAGPADAGARLSELLQSYWTQQG